MIRIVLIILLLSAVNVSAETVSIVVTNPTQQITVQPQTTIVAPESVTANVHVNQTGLDVVQISVPGPQGPPFYPFIASTTPPSNTNVFWVDSTDVAAPLLYVYLEGSWRQIIGGGTSPASNPTYNDNSNILFNDGSILTL